MINLPCLKVRRAIFSEIFSPQPSGRLRLFHDAQEFTRVSRLPLLQFCYCPSKRPRSAGLRDVHIVEASIQLFVVCNAIQRFHACPDLAAVHCTLGMKGAFPSWPACFVGPCQVAGKRPSLINAPLDRCRYQAKPLLWDSSLLNSDRYPATGFGPRPLLNRQVSAINAQPEVRFDSTDRRRQGQRGRSSGRPGAPETAISRCV